MSHSFSAMSGDWPRRGSAHRGFEVAQTQFEPPAAGIEGDELLGGVKNRGQQGSDQRNAAGSMAVDGSREAKKAHGDRGGSLRSLLGRKHVGLLIAFGPEEQGVVLGQTAGFAESDFAVLQGWLLEVRKARGFQWFHGVKTEQAPQV